MADQNQTSNVGNKPARMAAHKVAQKEQEKQQEEQRAEAHKRSQEAMEDQRKIKPSPTNDEINQAMRGNFPEGELEPSGAPEQMLHHSPEIHPPTREQRHRSMQPGPTKTYDTRAATEKK